MRSCCLLSSAMVLMSSVVMADVESGPIADSVVPKLEVFAVAGDTSGEAVEFVEKRESKPTLYCFIPADKFSRPTARLMRTLDDKLSGVASDGHIVAVWITGDAEMSKEYLGRVNMSLKLSSTTLCVYEKDANGPGEWGINSDASITVVVTKEGKVKGSFGYVSANETLADDVLKLLQ
ncbi:MAG: hypothetical protein R3C18_02345 [Planctomycetaceae bacterium]